jgi:hypothetical protein
VLRVTGAAPVAALVAVTAFGCTPGETEQNELLGVTQQRVNSCDASGDIPTIGGIDWISETIGPETGSACYDPVLGRFVLKSVGWGPDNNGSNVVEDAFQFVSVPVSDLDIEGPEGDVEIVARVISADRIAGVMIREEVVDPPSNDPPLAAGWYQNEAPATCQLPPLDDLGAFHGSGRPGQGVEPVVFHPIGDTRIKPPFWIRLQRVGNDYVISRRRDQGPWIPIAGGVFNPQDEANVRIGFFASDTQLYTRIERSAEFESIYVGDVRSDHRSTSIGSSHSVASEGFVTFGIDAFYVAPDGTSYKYYAQSEGGHSLDAFDSEGTIIALPESEFSGVGQGGITGNSTHIHILTTQKLQNGLIATKLEFRPNHPTIPTPLPIDFGTNVIGGITANDQHIFVSDRTLNEVRVYSTVGVEQPPISFENPGLLAVDHGGHLWIGQMPDVRGSLTPNFALNPGVKIKCLDLSSGTPCMNGGVPVEITVNNPTALAIAPNNPALTNGNENDKLLIARNGDHQNGAADQNILVCASLDATPECTQFGKPGGVFAEPTPGLVNDPASSSEPRFFSPIGVGVDESNNLYVASSAPRVEISKYAPEGSSWGAGERIAIGLSPEQGGFDPGADGSDFFMLTRHLTLDLSSPSVGAELASQSVTFDPFSGLTEDKRRLVGGLDDTDTGAPWIRRIGNGRFMFVAARKYELRIYRFTEQEEIAVPCGALELSATDCEEPSPSCVRLWVDSDGDGVRNEEVDRIQEMPRSGGFDVYVDDDGDIWLANDNKQGIWRLESRGVNGGIPDYDLNERSGLPTIPAPFDDAASIVGPQAIFQVRNVRNAPGSPYDSSLFIYGRVPSGEAQAAPCSLGSKTRIAVVRYDYDSATWPNLASPQIFYLPDAVFERGQPTDFYKLDWDVSCGCDEDHCDPWLACAPCLDQDSEPCCGQPGCSCGGFDCSNASACAKPGCDFDWQPRSFDVEGDYFFVQDRLGPVHVRNRTTGAEVAQLFAGPELSGHESASLTYGTTQAFKRSNGEYLVTATDISRQARTLLFRWTPTWTPKDLAPTAWYRAEASDVVYDEQTGNMIRWRDHSENGREVIQTVAGYHPTYSPTGWKGSKPTVTFNGTSSFLRNNDWGNLPPLGAEQPYTILVVMKASGVQTGGIASWWGQGSTVGAAKIEADGAELFLKGFRSVVGGGEQSVRGNVDIAAGRHALAYRYEAGTFRFTVDGVTSDPENRATLSSWSGDHLFFLGREDPFYSYYFKGDISELVIVPSAISDDDISKFTDYAKTEWGLGKPPGEDCEVGSECDSGFCVNGICCRNSCTSENSCVGNLQCVNASELPEERGICLGTVFEDGTPCDDGDPDTTDEQCQSGECVSGSWSPSDLSPTLWFFASPEYVTTGSGGTVTTWADRANDYDVTMTVSGYHAIYSSTGWNGEKPTVTFNGTTSLLWHDPWPTVNPIGDEEPYTVLAVMKAASIQSGPITSWWGYGGRVGALLHADGSNLFLKSHRAGAFPGTEHEFIGNINLSTSRHVLAYRYDGAGVFKLTVDGSTNESCPATQPSCYLGTVNAMVGGPSTNELLLGWSDGPGYTKFHGDISEIVVVPEAISDEQVQNFRTYAQGTWGGL